MPIAADRLALYPGGSIRSPEWLAIRARIQARSDNCCEQCGVRNAALGYRLPDGDFFYLDAAYRPGETYEVSWLDARHYPSIWRTETFKVIRIVCTVAHRDGELVDHSDENLAFLCQRDHNKLDAPSRAKNAAATRKARKPVTLLDLMEVPN